MAEAQQRASRAAVRAVRREEILASTSASTSANETHVVESEGADSRTHDQQTETDHAGDLPVDIFEEEHFLKDDGKVLYYTGLPNGEFLSSVFRLVIPYPGTSRKYYAKQKHLGCKKGEANQKQQLSDYKYTHSYTCD